jgi:glycosyltransferase involved in cell wall biosynthesis
LRVLQVMECTIGGTRRHIVDVSQGLVRAGLDVHIVVACERAPDFAVDLERLAAHGVRVTRLPMVRAIRPALDARHGLFLARLLERERPDVVHTHSSKAGVLGRLASLAAGVGARVHTPHTFSFLFDSMFSASKRRMFFEIERALAGHTQRLIAVSVSEARTIGRSGVAPAQRVRVVHNGIDPAPYLDARAASRDDLRLLDTRPLAVVVGLLNVAKGQDMALETLAQPGLQELQLLFVGDGELRTSLERRSAALGLTERVRFLGFRSDVPALLACADLVLMPSRWEGMPYIALEAMASARTLVATPVDGAIDLIEHGKNGLLARAIDARAIGDALRTALALSSAERAELGRVARERLLAGFSSERMVQGLLDVYREVA